MSVTPKVLGERLMFLVDLHGNALPIVEHLSAKLWLTSEQLAEMQFSCRSMLTSMRSI